MMDHYGITSFTLCLLSHGRAIPSCSETEYFHLTGWIELWGVGISSEATLPFPLMNISNQNVSELDSARSQDRGSANFLLAAHSATVLRKY